MSLYPIIPGADPIASDVNQVVDIFSGKHDIGLVTWAATALPPTAPSVALSAGTELSIGAYKYMITYVTGYYKSDGTLLKSGETTPSPASASITTISGSQRINVTNIPVGTIGAVVGRFIYRTKAGGSTYYLVKQILDNTTTSFLDTIPDAALPTTTPPAQNTTGTYFRNIELGAKTFIDTPFVDFNSSGFSNDYDVRLIASGGTSGTNGQGALEIKASSLNLSNIPLQFLILNGNTTFTTTNNMTFNIGSGANATYANLEAGVGAIIWRSNYARLVMANSTADMRIERYDGGAATLTVGTVVQTSDETKKKDIEDYAGSALAEIISTPIKKYRFIEDLETDPKRVGIMMQEAPMDVIDIKGAGVEPYAMVALAWKAIQELEARVAQLEAVK